MTAPIGPTSPSSTTPFSSAVAPGGPMGKNEFVKLLVAQMTHQDPLNPMDGQQLASQLAQFSSVEQLMNIGNKLDAQAESNAGLIGAMNNSAAMTLLGRDVTVATDYIDVGPNGTQSAEADVPDGGGNLTLRVTDEDGNTLHTVDLGFFAAGNAKIDLAGATAGLPDGTYRIAVDCNAGGEVTQLPPRISAHVDGVRFSGSGAFVTSGSVAYPISSIVTIAAN
jgi:flagellar basal-body rod modification protein FlgD